jgi:predicted metal-dependent hydrolase
MKHSISVSGIDIELVRKDIKNLHIGVYPPEGRVRVAAPLLLDDDAVRLAVISKLSWIKKQKRNFKEQPRQSKREFVQRESHYFLGRRYLLNVIEHDGPAKVEIRSARKMDLFVRQGMDTEQREKVLNEWYRRELKARIPPLIEKWEEIIGVQIAEWGVKRMKTKWGSCNIEARRIWFNLELAKKPLPCLEYIVVHEMVHILERHHNERFTSLMDAFLPSWRISRDELNRFPLKHEKWVY